jgi:hypothetical protein
VRCIGATVVLRIAQPDNGWRMEVEEPGPAEVKVRFERADDSSGKAARVRAVCQTGNPVFRLDNEG